MNEKHISMTLEQHQHMEHGSANLHFNQDFHNSTIPWPQQHHIVTIPQQYLRLCNVSRCTAGISHLQLVWPHSQLPLSIRLFREFATWTAIVSPRKARYLLDCVVLCCVVLYWTVLYGTVLYCIWNCYIVLYWCNALYLLHCIAVHCQCYNKPVSLYYRIISYYDLWHYGTRRYVSGRPACHSETCFDIFAWHEPANTPALSSLAWLELIASLELQFCSLDSQDKVSRWGILSSKVPTAFKTRMLRDRISQMQSRQGVLHSGRDKAVTSWPLPRLRWN